MSGAESELKIEKRDLGHASVEQATNCLRRLAEPVIRRKKKRQVLAANLLEIGKAGPLLPDQTVVRAIETGVGWFKVPDPIWRKVFYDFVTAPHLACQLDSVFGEAVRTSHKGSTLRQEIVLPTVKPGIVLLRVEEYDAETGRQTLLGFEIAQKSEL